MAASAKANLPTKSPCAWRVIDPLSGEVGKHPNAKSLRHVRRSNLSGMRAVCLANRYTSLPLFFVSVDSK